MPSFQGGSPSTFHTFHRKAALSYVVSDIWGKRMAFCQQKASQTCAAKWDFELCKTQFGYFSLVQFGGAICCFRVMFCQDFGSYTTAHSSNTDAARLVSWLVRKGNCTWKRHFDCEKSLPVPGNPGSDRVPTARHTSVDALGFVNFAAWGSFWSYATWLALSNWVPW